MMDVQSLRVDVVNLRVEADVVDVVRNRNVAGPLSRADVAAAFVVVSAIAPGSGRVRMCCCGR